MAAGVQGKFFEFDHLIFTKQREIPRMLQAKAQELGKPGQEREDEHVPGGGHEDVEEQAAAAHDAG